MKLETKLIIAAAGVGLVAWLASRAAAAVKETAGQVVETVAATVTEAAHAVSPLNNQNVIYSAVGQAVTGQAVEDKPLGVWLWEKLNPEAVERERKALAQPVKVGIDGGKP